MKVGIVAEFATPEALLPAVTQLRAGGYRMIDTYTPYPIKGLETALGFRRSALARAIFPAGALGVVFAFFLQWLLNGYLYPLNVGGRPPFSPQAAIIIAFETMVLFSGVGVFVLFFWVCRMPWLTHPLFRVHGFESASIDRFWLGINAEDEQFDPERSERELRDLGAIRVEFVGGRA